MQRRNAVTILPILLATLMAVGATASDESALVERALVRLEDLDSDPLRLPPAPAAPEEIEVRQRLAIARSILTMQSELDTSLAVLTGKVLPLLSLARNHHHLGLRLRALEWYRRAEIADKKNEYADDILSERLEVALELGDSSLVADLAGEMLDRSDDSAWSPHLARVLAFLATLPDATEPALEIARRTERLDGSLDPACVIELARLYQRHDDDRAALAHYRSLLRRQRDLSPRQLALTLWGLGDTYLASGQTHRALPLLKTCREHDVGRLSAWATYQMAGLAATAGRFDEAEHLFRSICEREADTPWRDDACTRLAQVRELQEIDAALRPFGRTLPGTEETR